MVWCPICNARFKVFEPFGLVQRENARCKRCKSLERHRLLFLHLQANDFFKENNNIKLLHFAPEQFFYDIFSKKQNIEYVPCDLNPEPFFKGEIEIVKVDITNIPFKDNYFDVILCSHVLEHIPDDKKAMSELYRVMKKGGWGIFQVPIDENRKRTYEDFTITTAEGREKAFGQSDHVRLYGLDYKLKLKRAGFKVTRHKAKYTPAELLHMGLVPQIIYRANKI